MMYVENYLQELERKITFINKDRAKGSYRGIRRTVLDDAEAGRKVHSNFPVDEKYIGGENLDEVWENLSSGGAGGQFIAEMSIYMMAITNKVPYSQSHINNLRSFLEERLHYSKCNIERNIDSGYYKHISNPELKNSIKRIKLLIGRLRHVILFTEQTILRYTDMPPVELPFKKEILEDLGSIEEVLEEVVSTFLDNATIRQHGLTANAMKMLDGDEGDIYPYAKSYCESRELDVDYVTPWNPKDENRDRNRKTFDNAMNPDIESMINPTLSRALFVALKKLLPEDYKQKFKERFDIDLDGSFQKYR